MKQLILIILLFCSFKLFGQQLASITYKEWNNNSVRNLEGHITDGNYIDLRDFAMPTNHTKITSSYGKRWGKLHEGLDIKVYKGDSIKSAFSGKVRIVKYDSSGWGYYIVIRHNNGLETLYAHLSKQLVKENDSVKVGQVIGLGGNSGRSTGSHLHFECRLFGKPINPEEIFDFPHQDIINNFYKIKQ